MESESLKKKKKILHLLSNTTFQIIQYSVDYSVGANPQHPEAAAALQEVAKETEINGVDSSSEEITTVLQHQQQEILRPLNSSRSIKQRPKTFHQQSLTKDEARKRMLSWRKTTQPRVRKPCNRSKSEDQG